MLSLEHILGRYKDILFIGIGNVLRSDDGTGVAISTAIRKRPGIRVLTVEVSIENYIGKIQSLRPEAIVFLDCMDLGEEPGSCSIFALDQLEDLTFNTHNISLGSLKEFFPFPNFLLGIQPETLDFGEHLSPPVRAAVKKILNQININTDIMSNNYYCPICRSNMNIGNSLVFSAKSPENDKGLIFLNTDLGDYTKTTHPDFELKEGVEYKFYCPVCHAKLNKEDNTNLVRVHMIDENGKEFEINISNIIGEHCTYKIEEKKVEAFGPDADRYRKYLDLPQEYQKYL